jgi:hypothetical protein
MALLIAGARALPPKSEVAQLFHFLLRNESQDVSVAPQRKPPKPTCSRLLAAARPEGSPVNRTDLRRLTCHRLFNIAQQIRSALAYATTAG